MEFGKKYSIREELIRLLKEDSEIRHLLLTIIGDRSEDLLTAEEEETEAVSAIPEHDSAMTKKVEILESKLQDVKVELEKHRAQVISNKKEIDREKDLRFEAERKVETLSEKISKMEIALQSERKKNELLDSEKKKLELKMQSVREQAGNLKTDLIQREEEGQALKNELARYSSFSELLDCYQLYRKLSDKVQGSLLSVRADSVLTFLSSCLQRDTIEGIWEYISVCYDRLERQELETLKTIFLYFFRLHQVGGGSLELLTPVVGEESDEDIHIRSSGSAVVSGVVVRVILQGYRNKKTGRIVKKSIVELGRS